MVVQWTYTVVHRTYSGLQGATTQHHTVNFFNTHHTKLNIFDQLSNKDKTGEKGKNNKFERDISAPLQYDYKNVWWTNTELSKTPKPGTKANLFHRIGNKITVFPQSLANKNGTNVKTNPKKDATAATKRKNTGNTTPYDELPADYLNYGPNRARTKKHYYVFKQDANGPFSMTANQTDIVISKNDVGGTRISLQNDQMFDGDASLNEFDYIVAYNNTNNVGYPRDETATPEEIVYKIKNAKEFADHNPEKDFQIVIEAGNDKIPLPKEYMPGAPSKNIERIGTPPTLAAKDPFRIEVPNEEQSKVHTTTKKSVKTYHNFHIPVTEAFHNQGYHSTPNNSLRNILKTPSSNHNQFFKGVSRTSNNINALNSATTPFGINHSYGYKNGNNPLNINKVTQNNNRIKYTNVIRSTKGRPMYKGVFPALGTPSDAFEKERGPAGFDFSQKRQGMMDYPNPEAPHYEQPEDNIDAAIDYRILGYFVTTPLSERETQETAATTVTPPKGTSRNPLLPTDMQQYFDEPIIVERDITTFMRDMAKQMVDMKVGFFSIFLIKLFESIAMKSDIDVLPLLRAAEREASILLYDEHLLDKWGEPFGTSFMNFARSLGGAAPDAIKGISQMLHHVMLNRKTGVTQDFNSLIDYIDTLYEEYEGIELLKVSEKIREYPNKIGNITAPKLHRELSKALYRPLERLKDSVQRQILIDSVNQLITNRMKPIRLDRRKYFLQTSNGMYRQKHMVHRTTPVMRDRNRIFERQTQATRANNRFFKRKAKMTIFWNLPGWQKERNTMKFVTPNNIAVAKIWHVKNKEMGLEKTGKESVVDKKTILTMNRTQLIAQLESVGDVDDIINKEHLEYSNKSGNDNEKRDNVKMSEETEEYAHLKSNKKLTLKKNITKEREGIQSNRINKTLIKKELKNKNAKDYNTKENIAALNKNLSESSTTTYENEKKHKKITKENVEAGTINDGSLSDDEQIEKKKKVKIKTNKKTRNSPTTEAESNEIKKKAGSKKKEKPNAKNRIESTEDTSLSGEEEESKESKLINSNKIIKPNADASISKNGHKKNEKKGKPNSKYKINVTKDMSLSTDAEDDSKKDKSAEYDSVSEDKEQHKTKKRINTDDKIKPSYQSSASQDEQDTPKQTHKVSTKKRKNIKNKITDKQRKLKRTLNKKLRKIKKASTKKSSKGMKVKKKSTDKQHKYKLKHNENLETSATDDTIEVSRSEEETTKTPAEITSKTTKEYEELMDNLEYENVNNEVTDLSGLDYPKKKRFTIKPRIPYKEKTSGKETNVRLRDAAKTGTRKWKMKKVDEGPRGVNAYIPTTPDIYYYDMVTTTPTPGQKYSASEVTQKHSMSDNIYRPKSNVHPARKGKHKKSKHTNLYLLKRGIKHLKRKHPKLYKKFIRHRKKRHGKKGKSHKKHKKILKSERKMNLRKQYKDMKHHFQHLLKHYLSKKSNFQSMFDPDDTSEECRGLRLEMNDTTEYAHLHDAFKSVENKILSKARHKARKMEVLRAQTKIGTTIPSTVKTSMQYDSYDDDQINKIWQQRPTPRIVETNPQFSKYTRSIKVDPGLKTEKAKTERKPLDDIKYSLSYSDDEDTLRFSLYDAMRHENVNTRNFRRNNDDVMPKKDPLTQFSSYSSDEVVIKTNIYKQVGFNNGRANFSEIVRTSDSKSPVNGSMRSVNDDSIYTDEESLLKDRLKLMA